MCSAEDDKVDTHSELEPIEAEMFLLALELETVDLEEPEMAYMDSRARRWARAETIFEVGQVE